MSNSVRKERGMCERGRPMAPSAEQSPATRLKILEAAETEFASHGFDGASTRAIAATAGVNQGLITYHFGSKLALWEAVMTRAFDRAREAVEGRVQAAGPDDRARAGALARGLVAFPAENPDLLRMMLNEGKVADGRLRWLIDRHTRFGYQNFLTHAGALGFAGQPERAPHVWYAMLGAASTVFALAPECSALTGTDPLDDDFISAHADYVAELFLSGEPE